MNLRFYAAVVTGALVEFLTLASLWAWSDMELIGMAFCSAWAYIFSLAVVMYITKPRKQQEELERQQERRRRGPQLYDLKAAGRMEVQQELEEVTA